MWQVMHERQDVSIIAIPDWLAIRQQLDVSGQSGYALAEWSFLRGTQAQSLSLAFLWGYQAAMRRVDPLLPDQQLAAWCVSESGLSSLRAMTTEYDPVTQTVNGRKSHVMLMASQQLDVMYVLARLKASESLLALKVRADAAGICVSEASKPQPFVAQVPHAAVTFTHTPVDDGFYVDDAHARLDRPFRFWEDCYVSCAFAGWFWRQLPTSSRSLLEQAVQAWLQHIAMNDRDYDAQHLALGSALLAQMNALSGDLPPSAALQWAQDSKLLILGERARQALRQRFSAVN